MTWHNSGKTPEIEHDAQSSRRYKEDLDDLWLRIKALEIEVSSLRQVRDAVLDCEGVEMRNCYEVPKDEWEAAMSFATHTARGEASNVANKLPALAGQLDLRVGRPVDEAKKGGVR